MQKLKTRVKLLSQARPDFTHMSLWQALPSRELCERKKVFVEPAKELTRVSANIISLHKLPESLFLGGLHLQTSSKDAERGFLSLLSILRFKDCLLVLRNTSLRKPGCFIQRVGKRKGVGLRVRFLFLAKFITIGSALTFLSLISAKL